MRPTRLVLLLSAVLALTVLWRLPARWLAAALPDQMRCATLAGSVWRGRCGELQVGALRLQSLSWRLQALELLRGRAAAELVLTDARVTAQGALSAALGGTLHVSELSFNAALDSSWLQLVPSGWSAQLSGHMSSLTIEQGELKQADGELKLERLILPGAGAALGSYAVQLRSSAEGIIEGKLGELEGALGVSGTLQLRPAREYELNALLVPRAGAPELLLRQLEMLGPPNASGQRTLSIAGVY